MGFFKRPAGVGSPVRALAADPDVSRRYLEFAFPMSRIGTLAKSCQFNLARAPIADKSRHGHVVMRDELATVTALVRKVMVLDRDLSAWVALADVETPGYEITACSSIVSARSKNTGKLTRGFPDNLRDNVLDVPAMWCAGWYPSPTHNTSGDTTASGDAKMQRFWDSQWTDRARISSNGRWSELTKSLHAAPDVPGFLG